MSDHVVSPATAPPRVTISSPKSHGSLDADIIIKNAPDPVFVSDLEGKILSANDAVYELLGFRTDEVLEQSLSRFISPEETREFTAALREVIERGATRNARLNPRSASGEVIPTTLNASALRDADGKVRPTMRSTNCWAFAPTRCWSSRSRALSAPKRHESLPLPYAR